MLLRAGGHRTVRTMGSALRTDRLTGLARTRTPLPRVRQVVRAMRAMISVPSSGPVHEGSTGCASCNSKAERKRNAEREQEQRGGPVIRAPRSDEAAWLDYQEVVRGAGCWRAAVHHDVCRYESALQTQSKRIVLPRGQLRRALRKGLG